jgi:hypothetical protein
MVLGLFVPFWRPFKVFAENGFKRTILQLYTVGQLKSGVFKGSDKFGNKYVYELITEDEIL